MAKQKTNQVGNTAFDEAGLKTFNREKLLEAAKEFELAFTEQTTEEDIIKAILEAQKKESETSQETPNPPPPADNNGKGSGPGEKVRIKNETCKNGKLFLGNGELAVFDENGIAEIDAEQAERLLRIPGYEKA